MDMGTREFSQHHLVIPKLVDPTTMAGRVLDATEIDRLLLNEAIGIIMHGTLEAFAKKLHSFGFVGLKSPDYSSPIFADATAVSEKKANLIRGAVALFNRMDKHPDIGPYRRKKIVNLVLTDAPWQGKKKQLSEDQIEELHKVIRALDQIFSQR